jgi:hypothetical protein
MGGFFGRAKLSAKKKLVIACLRAVKRVRL